MIFVTVGTNEAPFDRLVSAVGELETDETVVVQHGSSAVRPENTVLFDFLPFERIVENVRSARVVVMHAGVGSIMVALANGKRAIVVPRRRSHGEAVDDHQVFFGRRFADAGLVTYVESADDLAEALIGEQPRAPTLARSGALAADLRGFLENEILGPAAAAG